MTRIDKKRRMLGGDGRGGETRTPGLYVPNVARYQLRHTPMTILIVAATLQPRQQQAEIALTRTHVLF